jgi:hypothetical protein
MRGDRRRGRLKSENHLGATLIRNEKVRGSTPLGLHQPSPATQRRAKAAAPKRGDGGPGTRFGLTDYDSASRRLKLARSRGCVLFRSGPSKAQLRLNLNSNSNLNPNPNWPPKGGAVVPLCKTGSHFDLLPRFDDQIFAGGPDLVVEQHFEGNRGGNGLRPAPSAAVHANECLAALPSQAGTLASQVYGVAKSYVHLDINGRQDAGSRRRRICGGCRFGRGCRSHRSYWG